MADPLARMITAINQSLEDVLESLGERRDPVEQLRDAGRIYGEVVGSDAVRVTYLAEDGAIRFSAPLSVPVRGG